MPIEGIEQPSIRPVGEGIRLRKYDDVNGFALAWYQDEDMVYLVDGVRRAYDEATLHRMYTYLNNQGELYWIEVEENGTWRPIGDVTFWQEDMPIVIGEAAYRGKGIGRRVIASLVQRGRELGYDRLRVEDIYDWNQGSRRCFESVGFRACKKTENGSSYELTLSSEKA